MCVRNLPHEMLTMYMYTSITNKNQKMFILTSPTAALSLILSKKFCIEEEQGRCQSFGSHHNT